MTILSVVYASAPTENVLIPTLAIRSSVFDTVYLCPGFEDQPAKTETGADVTFIASGIDVALPKRDATGQQALTFAIDNVTGEAQRMIDDAMTAGEKVYIDYREYIWPDMNVVAKGPITLTLVGGQMNGPTLQIQASHYDILNTAWPRKRYTAEFAPGLKYFR